MNAVIILGIGVFLIYVSIGTDLLDYIIKGKGSTTPPASSGGGSW